MLPVLAAAVVANPINRLGCHLKLDLQAIDHISGIGQWISMNEVSKCEEINCPSFGHLHFSLANVNIEIGSLKLLFRNLC